MHRFGTLDYSHAQGTWGIVPREGEPIPVEVGDTIILGYVQGEEVLATLVEDSMGNLVWCSNAVDTTPKPGKPATIRQTA